MISWAIRLGLVGLFCLPPALSLAEDSPPNGKLSIGYRQLLDGNLSKAVYYATLTCYDGDCALVTLILNQCLPTPFGTEEAFIPKVERSTTSEGTLSLHMPETNRLVVNEKTGEALYTYGFTFTSHEDKERAARLKVRQARFFNDTQSVERFKGEAVKTSLASAKTVAWELVPLKNPRKGAWPMIEPACKFTLPDGGVDE